MLVTASTDTVTAWNILSNANTMNAEKAPGNRHHVLPAYYEGNRKYRTP